MTVLITGPTGAAGQYIVERALTTDEKVRVLALPETLHRILYRNQIEIIPGTLENEEAVLEAVRGVETIYHAALLAPPPNRTPDELQRVNVEGTRRVLEASAGDIKRFVLVSTNLVYSVHHTPDTWPVRANTERLRPGDSHMTPYSQSMIDVEDFVFEASATYGMEYAILRPTTVCGRTARFVERLLTRLVQDPERVAPQTHALFPGMQWIHGTDLGRAALLAATRPEAKNQIYNVAGDESVTAYSLLATIWEITHPEGGGNPYAQLAAEHRPPLLKFDIEKIRTDLGFEPQIKVRECIAELLGRYEFFTAMSLEMPRLPTALDFDAGIEELPMLPNTVVDRVPRAATPPAVAAPPAVAPPANADIRDKTCIITGATSGIGLATAEALARMGAKLVLVGRDRDKGEATLKRFHELVPGAEVRMLFGDLSRLADVRRVAQEILESTPRIDVLINNVGAVFSDREITSDGLERTFAVNHMSHFLLATLLRDRLVASSPARIVTVASSGHRGFELDLDDLQGERSFDPKIATKRAKLCNILFTRELAKRLSGTSVTANCLCPGFVATGIGDDMDSRVRPNLARAKATRAIPPGQGAAKVVYLASAQEVADISGAYFENSRLAQPSLAARDDNAAAILWNKSLELSGLYADGDTAPRKAPAARRARHAKSRLGGRAEA